MQSKLLTQAAHLCKPRIPGLVFGTKEVTHMSATEKEAIREAWFVISSQTVIKVGRSSIKI